MTDDVGELTQAARQSRRASRDEIPLVAERVAAALIAASLAERERWFLWLPVAMGTGIALYFALYREPAPWAGSTALAVTVAAIAAGWRRPALRFVAVVLALAAFGFCVAQWRAHWVAAPVIEDRTRAVVVSGRVAAVETRPTGTRGRHRSA